MKKEHLTSLIAAAFSFVAFEAAHADQLLESGEKNIMLAQHGCKEDCGTVLKEEKADTRAEPEGDSKKIVAPDQ